MIGRLKSETVLKQRTSSQETVAGCVFPEDRARLTALLFFAQRCAGFQPGPDNWDALRRHR
jgi:hypothetical protein